jgi:homoserine dehydrogenase
MEKKIRLGIIGCGTVGSHTGRILTEKREFFRKTTGVDFEILRVCDIAWNKKNPWLPEEKIRTDNPYTITTNPEIDIVVELIGNIHPAHDIITSSLSSGKSVVTANKHLLSLHLIDLLTHAKEHSNRLRFEASVAGAIPVIKALRESFSANTITKIAGILNGTTNHILSSMTSLGYSFKEALADAQSRGYAEANPSLDLSGNDSAQKLAILSTYAFHKPITPADIFIEGIESIEYDDINFAGKLGYKIKLLAVATLHNGSISLTVQPSCVPHTHLLSNIEGVYNAIYFEGDLFGKSLLYGEGAGGDAAASAVVADIIEIGITRSHNAPVSESVYTDPSLSIDNPLKTSSPFYFRFTALDKPGVLAAIARVLGEHTISISSVIQQRQDPQKPVPIVMLTHSAKLEDVQKALAIINTIPTIKEPAKMIRVQE